MVKTRLTLFKESIEKLTKEIEKNVLKNKKSIKSEFKEAFSRICDKYKIFCKLNELDEFILEGRYTNRDLKSPEYIKEIYKSYGVEDKNKLFEYLDGYSEKIKIKEQDMKNEIDEIDKEIENIKNTNKEYEKKYKNLVTRVESTMQRRI
ncbi:hypothetical protein DMUE_0478 [Dictyocoela muelleri]|nr:hypothetical protein DMUE_0478 [Dictyocoela muelleri]